jgi:hypothetical protein
MAQLGDFLGHRDGAKIKGENLVPWKGSLIASGLAAKTIRESHLAPFLAITPRIPLIAETWYPDSIFALRT